MRLQIDKLGKVAITIEKDYWDINKDYDKLTIVEVKHKFGTYISRKPVLRGTDIDNREYWIPFSSLQESIVIDYNKFIEECTKTINNKLPQLIEQYSKNSVPLIINTTEGSSFKWNIFISSFENTTPNYYYYSEAISIGDFEEI